MATDNIKIFISYHKDGFVPKRKYLYPIQVGSKIAKKRLPDMLHDDEGDNISELNPMYCELTAQYWAWKNEDADYYGFFHYRRYLSFAKKTFKASKFEDVEIDYLTDATLDEIGIEENAMHDLINQYDVIVSSEVDLKKLNPILYSQYYQYKITPHQYAEDLDTCLDIIKETCPEYYETTKAYWDSPKGYFCNMFIMKKDLFHDYCAWLFPILEEHLKRRDISKYGPDATRVSGFLAERLFGAYYTYLKKTRPELKTTELQRTLFKNTDKMEHLKPAFEKNNIAIALAANETFMPYSAIFMKSIMEFAKPEDNYDFIILTEDAWEHTKDLTKRMFADYPNCSVRFLNPGALFSGYDFYLHGHFGSIETYYRLVLPELLPDYHKVAYLDSDLIANHDVAELYNTDVEGYLLAAVPDVDTAGLYNGYEPKKKQYTDTILQLKDPYKYFQAGVLVMNLDEFRKTYTTKHMLEFATSYKFELQDQDVLNCLCEDHVKFLDLNWNIMVDFNNGYRLKGIMRNAPIPMYNAYMEGRKDPYIIHFAGPQKPWISPEMDMGEYFWKYARQTPFYEWLMSRLGHAAASYEISISSGVSKMKNALPRVVESAKAASARVLPYDSKQREAVKRVYKSIFGKKK